MDKREESSTDQWTEHGPHSAKESHDDGREGELNVEGEGGVDIILIGKMDGTCEPDEEGTEDESNDFILSRMDTQRFCGLLIFTNGHQAKAEFGRKDFVTEKEGDEGK